jgi:hypothetical protein
VVYDVNSLVMNFNLSHYQSISTAGRRPIKWYRMRIAEQEQEHKLSRVTLRESP